MSDNRTTSPDGQPLALVAQAKTTATLNSEIKKIVIKRETIEVLVSDSRIVSSGSQFGHTAIAIDSNVYGRAHSRWDIDTRENYLYRQQVKMHRDTWGYTLVVSKDEKAKVLAEIKRRVAENKPYALDTNNCSSNVAEVLEFAAIPAYDPRWSGFMMISPADIMAGLSHSKRLIRKTTYSKK